MTTINLYQPGQENEEGKKTFTINKGFVFSIGMLVFVLLVFAGLKIYESTMNDRNQKLTDQIKTENDGLVGLGNIEKVVDVQTRLGKIKSSLASRIETNDLLDHLGSDMASGVVVASYKYDGDKKVAVSLNSNNFTDMSRQIVDFKKSTYLSAVNVASISREEKNIRCEIELTIK